MRKIILLLLFFSPVLFAKTVPFSIIKKNFDPPVTFHSTDGGKTAQGYAKGDSYRINWQNQSTRITINLGQTLFNTNSLFKLNTFISNLTNSSIYSCIISAYPTIKVQANNLIYSLTAALEYPLLFSLPKNMHVLSIPCNGYIFTLSYKQSFSQVVLTIQ